jgi:GAF domain-containing protein
MIELQSIAEELRDERDLRIGGGETQYLYAERLQILRDIDQAIVAARSPETIALAAIDRLHHLIPFQHAVVLAVGETEQLEMLAARSYNGFESRVEVTLYREVLRDPVLERGSVQGVEDLATVPRHTPLRQALYVAGIHSYVIVPLNAHGEVIGTLHLESDQSRAFSAEHIDTAIEMAASLAVAIRQARLYRLGQREVAERRQVEAALTKLLELSPALAKTEYLDETLAQTVKSAVEIVPRADACTLQWLDADGETLHTVATSDPDGASRRVPPFRVGVGVAGHALAFVFRALARDAPS